MKDFLTEHFLLETETAQRLYHNCAKHLPIIDYHCHLSPRDIAEDRQFDNLTEIWLNGDHYKWRAMRTLGIDEKYITGEGSNFEKFQKWAETVPYTLRNPLYHWTHLELKKYFGITKLLNADTAEEIYQKTAQKLQTGEFSTRNLLRRMDVKMVCTTDDPVDSLEHHAKIKSDDFDISVLPAFRPDQVYAFDDPETYNTYLDKLEEVSNIAIDNFDSLIRALEQRIDFFNQNGCKISDHGLKTIYYEPTTEENLNNWFRDIRRGQSLSPNQQRSLRYHILIELGKMYHKRGWVQQFHLGALRDTNKRMLDKAGKDSGFDSIGDYSHAEDLAAFLNELDKSNQLSKTILYNLNPKDNAVMATMAGNFNDGSTKGKMQYGPAWWYLDQKEGIEAQLDTLSNMGLLSSFVGMLTDSRSFLSYSRHEYFRRILCNLFGNDIENGELPHDLDLINSIISDICYYNAKEYFNLKIEEKVL